MRTPDTHTLSHTRNTLADFCCKEYLHMYLYISFHASFRECVYDVWQWQFPLKMQTHTHTHIPDIHQIEKLKIFSISRYKLNLRFWYDLNLYRGMRVSRFDEFVGCSNFSGNCQVWVGNTNTHTFKITYTHPPTLFTPTPTTHSLTSTHFTKANVSTYTFKHTHTHSPPPTQSHNRLNHTHLHYTHKHIHFCFQTTHLRTHTHTNTHTHAHTHVHRRKLQTYIQGGEDS